MVKNKLMKLMHIIANVKAFFLLTSQIKCGSVVVFCLHRLSNGSYQVLIVAVGDIV